MKKLSWLILLLLCAPTWAQGNEGGNVLTGTTVSLQMRSAPPLCPTGYVCLFVSSTGTPLITSNGVIKTLASTSGVASFNGRTGVVTPTANDYSFPLLAGQLADSQVAANGLSQSKISGLVAALAAKVEASSLAPVATSGAYNDLTGKPTLGTSAALNVAASGNAASGEVVKGSDSRLSDARAPTAHNQAWSTITATPTTLAGYAINDAAALSHTHTASQVSDSSAVGRTLLTAANAAAQRTALALGTTDDVSFGSLLTLNSTRGFYVPNQTNFTGSLFVGSGGTQLSHTTSVDGFYNLMMGLGAGYFVSTGSYNVGMGAQAVYNCSSCHDNVGMGTTALYGVTTGYSNTVIGSNAGTGITTGVGNVVIGSQSGGGMTTADYNTIIGANITGLSASLYRTVILADGLGAERFKADSSSAIIYGLLKVLSSGVIEYPGITFASLPAANDGSMVYCSNCMMTAVCVTGGTGAFAKRLNGVWVCN